jgi:Flp pilus assembly protein TadG
MTGYLIRRLGDQRGSIVVELALLLPVMMLVLSSAWVTNRTSFAARIVDAAAYASARAASLSRDGDTARTRATTSATDTLALQDLHCSHLTVEVDVSQFTRPVGQPATVTVTVVCVVNMADIAMPGMPGQRTVWARCTSPIDQYRARS